MASPLPPKLHFQRPEVSSSPSLTIISSHPHRLLRLSSQNLAKEIEILPGVALPRVLSMCEYRDSYFPEERSNSETNLIIMPIVNLSGTSLIKPVSPKRL
jgi:hypothetical protein